MPGEPKGTRFALEELEPRVLLSANLATLGTAVDAVGIVHEPAVIHAVNFDPHIAVSEALTYHNPVAAGDVFAGLEAMSHPASVAHPTAAAPVTPVAEVAPAVTPTAVAETAPAATPVVAAETVQQSASTPAAARISTTTPPVLAMTTSGAQGATTVSQMVTTLKAPNAPPAAAQVAGTDLQQFIQDLLASNTSSFSTTEQLSSAVLGNSLLQLTGVTLTVNATLTNGNWSGTATISATSATLFPGRSFSAAITSTTTDPAVTGTYTIGGSYTLTVPTTAKLVMNLGEALTVVASNTSFNFDPNGTATQTLATLTNVAATSTQFSSMPQANLTNFVLRADGFSFDGFTLASAASATPSITNLVTTTGVTLTVSAFNVSFGDGTNPASLSGTVGVSVTGFQLFPTAGLVQFQANSVSAAYNFGNFDGTSPTGQLSFTISGFKLGLGQAMQLTTGGTDVVLTPGQATMATIATATLSSPQFTGLGSITVTNLAIKQTGFTLGSAVWQSAGSVGLQDIITADSLTITLSNLTFNYGSQPSFDGGISVTAKNVVLFGGIPILNLHLGDLSGLYVLGNLVNNLTVPTLPYLSLHIPNLDIALGDLLTIHLGSFDLTPGFSTMLHLPDVDITANLFSGLPHFTLASFDLTQFGFDLGNLSFALPSAVTIGNFLSLGSLNINITGFSINKSLTPFVSGVVTVTLGDLSLFPGSSFVTTAVTNLRALFDFSSTAVVPGRFELLADSLSLGFGGQISLAAQNVTLTPALTTFATLGTVTASFAPLNNLSLSLTDVDLMRTGFMIASGQATLGSDLTIGSLLTLVKPTATLTNINYTLGGALTGTVGFDTASATLNLGSALDTTASHLAGSYNLSTNTLAVTMDSFGLNLAGFATLSGSNASLTYVPATDGTAKILVGVAGIDAFLGTGSGSSRTGIDVSNGTLTLAVFKAATSAITYALDAKGTINLLGMPANSLTAGGTIEFRKDTAGAVNEVINVGGNAVNLTFAGNEESVMGQGVTLGVGPSVSISGDFSFRQYSPDGGTTNYVVIGATKVNASLGAGGVSVNVNGGSLGLVIEAGATSGAATYALVANGGTDSLTGVTGLTLTGTGLSVRIRHGLDASVLTGLGSITTPSGSVSLDFSGLGSGSTDVTDVEGAVSLAVAGFVTVNGNFGFQQYTSGATSYFAVGVTSASIVLGNSSGNVTVSGATLGLVVAPGSPATQTAAATAATYVLEASGSASLNGVDGLTLSGTNIKVRVRRGLDLTTATGAPTSVLTSDGTVTFDFSDVGAGTSDLTDIRGHLKLGVTGFGSLEGDFGFQSFTDGKTGVQTIALGASNATIVLGTSTTNVTVTGATFGAILRPGSGTTATTYALEATATSASLNGAGDLTLSATKLMVRIRNGLDLATVTGAPTSIQTSGATVTLDFSGLPTGSGNLIDLQGDVTIGVGSFVTLSGSFGFQSYAVNSDNYLEIGATNLTATLAAGPVNLTIANASFGLIVKQGTPSTYALIAKGSSNPADTALNGVPGLSLSASNLLVRARSGLDVTTLPSTLPTAIHTPDGDVTLDFTGLGSGSTDVTDVEGHLTLSIANFVSLDGDFGFQKFTTGTSSAIAIGAANVNAVLGTSDVNVSISGASLGVLIAPGANGSPTTYALVANGGTDALNGVPDLTVSSSGLVVRVRHGLDPSTLSGAPTSVQVSGGNSVALSFTDLGSTDVTQVSGNVAINLANAIAIQGQFSFTQTTAGLWATLTSGTTSTLNGLAFGNSTYEAIGAAGTIATSSDGVTWTTQAVGTDALNAITYGGGRFVAVGDGGTILTRADAATSWTSATSGTANLTGVAYGNGSYVAVGAGGAILTSTDGATWTANTAVTTHDLHGITFAAGKFVAVGASGTVLTSADGATWTVANSGSTQNLNAVGFGAGVFTAAGDGGTILTSADGAAWTARASGTGSTLRGVAFGNAKLIVVGDNGAVLTSADGTTWSGDASTGTTALRAVLYTSTGYQVAGDSGTLLQSAAAASLTKILVGASGVNAYVGTPDKSLGVQITNASFGLVIYRDSSASGSTYALQASAPSITPIGLPSDIQLSGAATVAFNTTGHAVNETIPVVGTTVVFTDGSNHTADQRNIRSFGGSLTFAVLGANSTPIVTLTGDFSVSQTTSGTTTKLLIGAANVATAVNTSVAADGGGTFSLSNGTLGLVFFNDNGTNLGYSLVASATATATAGTTASANATLTIRRNSTLSKQAETVVVGTTSVPVDFSSTEVAQVGPPLAPFQQIVLSNASINIDDTIVVTAAKGTQTPYAGATTTALTGVTLTLQSPGTNPQVLFTISAGTANYTSFTDTVTPSAATSDPLPTRTDGANWIAGDKDLSLTNVTFSIGTFVTFSAAAVDLQHFSTTTTSGTVTTNSFAFTGATITFLVNGAPVVSLGGSPQFHYSTADGFKLDSFSNPTFSFLGASFGTASTSATRSTVLSTGTTSTTSTTDTSHTLGPITLAGPSVSLDNFAFNFDTNSPTGSADVTVSARITLSAASASIGTTGGPIQAKLTNVAGSFNLAATFDLLHLTGPPTISANGFQLTVDHFEVDIGSFLVLGAGTPQSPLSINPSATATQDLINFGTLSAELKVGGIDIKGSASNFAIEGNGTFITKAGFAVSLSIGQGGESSFSWPSWLPLKSASVTLVWTNFASDPTHFLIEVSATIDIPSFEGLQLSISGSVTNLVIDPSLVATGAFPIVSIGSFAVGVSGNLYGGTVTGKLIAGIVRFDANGNTVDGLGYISGTTTLATGPIRSAFYAGIEGGFNFAGEEGFNIMVGLSDYGPLQVYIEADVPVPLGPDGFFVSNFRGAVTFGDTFPTITLSDPVAAADALQLRKAGFTPPSNLTAAQWEQQLQTQVANLVRNNASQVDAWVHLVSSPIVIEAGATLYFGSSDAFRVDADLFIDTAGKFMVLGSATIGETVSRDVKIYADFSQAKDNVKILFLSETPSQNTPTPVTPPIISIYGIAVFSYTNSQFQISLAGGAELNVLGGLVARVEGTLTLTVTSNALNITLSNGAFTIPTLSSSPLGTAAGTLTIQNDNNTTEVWGGFLLNLNTQPLETYGIDLSGQVFVKLNTTSVAKQVSLQLDSGTTVLDLKAQSLSLFINGTASFSVNGAPLFQLNGTLTLDITSTSISIFADVGLTLGPDPASPLLSFHAVGLVYIQLVDTTDIHPGFAAKLTLTLNSPNSIPGLNFNMNWLLVVNTTGGDVTFFIPAPVPGGPTIPTILGPDYSSSNPLGTTSYEVTVDGQRALSIPSGPPGPGLTNYATWTASPANTSYLIVVGRGSATVGNVFFFTGALSIRASQGSFTLDTNANLALKANGNTIFNFNVVGGMQLSRSGIVAALTVTLQGGVPGNLGFSFNNASFQLLLNTTGVATTVNGINVSAGTNNLYADIRISGDLTFLGGVVKLHGTFDLTVTGSSLTLQIDADITFLNATLHASGFAGIYYDSSPGLALSIQLSLPGGAQGIAPVAAVGSNFVIKGTFTLQINTSAITRNGIAPGFSVAVTNLDVYLFGFNLTGSLSISITNQGFSIDIQNLTLDLFGFASITLNGYVHPDGSFMFTGTAGFQFGDHVFGLGGSISVSISNSGFSASVSGWVAAFGVEISGSGAITISGGSVDIYVSIYVVLFPAINIDTPDVYVDLGWFGGFTIPGIHIHTPAVVVSGTAHFHLGSTAPAPAAATVQIPPPPPPPPTIAGVNNGELVLYIGADVGSRTGATTAQDENYQLTAVSPGTNLGTQKIQVSALNTTMTFDNVSSILVRNTQTNNDTINIASSVDVPVNITLGTGSNNITTGSGPATVSVTGTGSLKGGSVITTGNGSSVTVSGGDSNTVSTGSNSTVTISGGGANHVTVNGNSGGNNSVTISGNGANQVTIIGSTPTSISVTGNGANQITSSSGATTLTLRGAGANQISTGAGFTTIYDQGTGATTVKGGVGGGTFIGGVTSTGAAFTTKGSSSLTTSAGNFAVQMSGYSNYTLSNASLLYGGFNLTLNGVRQVSLTAGSTTAANTFVLSNWTGSASLTGAGSNNSFTYSAAPSATNLDYVLSNAALKVTGSVTNTITLSDIQGAGLIGPASGTATFDVSGWTGTGALVASANAYNTLIATDDIASFTLTDTKLSRSGDGDIALSNIDAAFLTGGAGVNTFNVSSWSATATLDGAGGNDSYVLSLSGSGTGTINVTDSGASTADTITLSGSRNIFVTATQVKVGTQTVNYSGIEGLAITGTTNGLSYNVRSTHAGTTTTIQTGGAASVISVGSTAGLIPVTAGNVDGIQGALSVAGGGTMTVDDTASVVAKSGTLTPTTLTGFGMAAGGITYANLSSLTISLGSGADTVAINDITPATVTTIHAGASTGDTVNASFAADFTGTLNLTGFEHGTVAVAGNFGGTLNDSGPGHLETVAIGQNGTGSLLASGRFSAGSVDAMTVAQDLAGIVDITGTLGTLSVGRDVSGSVNETGIISQLTIGRDLTATGTITATNATAALAGIGTMKVGRDLAGHLTVSGDVAALSVGGNLSGQVSVGGALTHLDVAGDVSGTVTESGTIATLAIGGSLTSTGVLTASNPADLAEVTGGPQVFHGDIGTMTVGQNLAGTVLVTGSFGSLSVGTAGDNNLLSGTVTVQGALTTLNVTGDVSGKVTTTGPAGQMHISGSVALTGLIKLFNLNDPVALLGSATEIDVGLDVAGAILVSGRIAKLAVGRDVSGTVTEAGTVDSLTIGGSLTATGIITAANPADPAQVPLAAVATLGNITTMSVAHDLAGRLSVSGTLGSLAVGTPSIAGNLSGTVAVHGALTALTVTGDVSGAVTESGLVNSLVVGGSLTATGRITASNTQDSAQFVPSGDVAIASVGTLTIGHNLAGTVLITGNVGSFTTGTGAADTLGGTVTIQGNTAAFTANGNVTGTLTSHGAVTALTVNGTLASSGTFLVRNTADPALYPLGGAATYGNVGTLTVTDDVAGHVTVTGNVTTFNIGGGLSGTVLVQGAITTLTVGADVSGHVTESGTVNLLTIGGSLTGTITASNLPNDPAQVPLNAVTTLANIVTMTVAHNVSGTLLVTGNVGTLTIGSGSDLVSGSVTVQGALSTLLVNGDVSGTIFETGASQSLTVTGSLTSTGTITAKNTQDSAQFVPTGDVAIASVGTFTLGHNLAGTVLITGNVGAFTTGTGAADTLSGTVTIQGNTTTLTANGTVTGSVTTHGAVMTFTVNGSVAATGVITIQNDADPAQVPVTAVPTYGNIGTLLVTGDLAGKLTVSGNVTTFTDNGTISGTVYVHGAITTLTVGGDVSGQLTETGLIDQATISGSLTGTVDVLNTQDSAQVVGAGQVTLADINTMTVGHNISGTLAVTGNLGIVSSHTGGLTVGTTTADAISGTVTVQNTLTNLRVSGDISGRVAESGLVTLVQIGGSLTSTGTLTLKNTQDSAQFVPTGDVAFASLTTLTLAHDLAGTVLITGNVGSFTTGTGAADTLSGTVTIQGNTATFTVNGTITGSVTTHGAVTTFTVNGSIATTGVITVQNDADPAQVPVTAVPTYGNIGTLLVTGDLAGKLTVSGNVTTFTDNGTISGTVYVHGAITTLTVGGDISGQLTETGLIDQATIGGSLTGTVNVLNTQDSAQVVGAGQVTLADINTMTVGHNISGTLAVTGNLGIVSSNTGGLTVGTTAADSISGTVTVQNTLTNLTVSGDISGRVAESGLVTLIQVGGSLTSTGTLTLKNTQDSAQFVPTGDVAFASLTTLTLAHDLAGTVLITGNVGAFTTGTGAADTLGGTVTIQGNTTTFTANGTITGSVTTHGAVTTFTVNGTIAGTGRILVQNNADPALYPLGGGATYGNITTATVTGDVAGEMTITGNVTTFTVGGSISGTVLVQGAITTLTVGADVSGHVTESGTVNLLTIGGSLSGTITASNLPNDPAQVPLNPVTTLANIVTMTVGHNLSGVLHVTGNVGTLTVGSGATDVLSGSVTVNGALSILTVNGTVSGSVFETGAVATITINGSVSHTGTITAQNTNDSAQFLATGQVAIASIATMTVTHTFDGILTVSGNVGSLTVGSGAPDRLSGLVKVQGAITNLVVNGDVSGAVYETGTINVLTITGSLLLTGTQTYGSTTVATGLISAWNTNLPLGNITTLTIGKDFLGTILVSGNIHSFTIISGQMGPLALLKTGSLDTMIIGPDQLSVGQNMAGTILVVGTFGSLRVAGGTPGLINAGHIGTLAVYGGFGPVVLDVIENGTERLVTATLPTADPYPLENHNTTAATMSGSAGAYVNVQFFYESGSLSNPQLTARITNGVGTAPMQYDFTLITYSDTAKFNLARFDAAGVAGVRNVVVEGDLLTSVSSQAAAFFRGDTTAAGIRLPADNIAGVSIRDYAPNGFIQAHSAMAVAFGSYTEENGRLDTGVNANQDDARALFTSDTLLVPAAETFRVAFADLPTQQVALFFVSDAHGGHFDNQSVQFTVQSVATANAAGTANIVTPSNVARGAATALVTTMPTYDKNGHQDESVIQTVAIRGDGASITTKQWISTAITSTGPLGDLTLGNSQGVADITAPAIFGSITSPGPLFGTVQTTGLRTDPISGVVTTVAGDLGRLYVVQTHKGPVVVTTTIDVEGHGITGRLIVRGDLISSYQGQLSGTIAVQGNLGIDRGTGASTVRYGGLTIEGGLNGSIVVLGQQLADVTIHGGIEETGSYTVAGGILGNLVTDGIDAGGKLISGGQIGDASQHTSFTSGKNNGIIAAYGSILFAKSSPGGNLFSGLGANPGSASAVALQAIFTQGGTALRLDVSGLDLQGLASILADVAALKMSGGTLTGPTP